MASKPRPQFFPTPDDWREWLKENHAIVEELWVGFHKKDSGKPSITWQESVDGALCFGWVDGVRKSLNETSYVIRFTPRRARSNWSGINIRRAKELSDLGLMHPAGQKAFERRSDNRSQIYSYEQRHEAKLSPGDEKRFRANKAAWKFFQSMPPWYRRTSTYWVVTAKKEETRKKRLDQLIRDSEKNLSIAQLRQPAKKKS